MCHECPEILRLNSVVEVVKKPDSNRRHVGKVAVTSKYNHGNGFLISKLFRCISNKETKTRPQVASPTVPSLTLVRFTLTLQAPAWNLKE
jgi:hypothetical protein